MAGCSVKVSKWILVSLNIVFFLIGAASIGLGIFLICDTSPLGGLLAKIPMDLSFDPNAVLNQAEESTSFLTNGAYAFIAIGAVIFIIASAGLIGALTRNTCFLTSYATIIILVVVVEAAITAICYLYGGLAEQYLKGWLSALIANKYSGATLENVNGINNTYQQSSDTTGISDAVDLAQINFACCGINNYTDFQSAADWPGQYNFTSEGVPGTISAVVPISCCKIMDLGDGNWPVDMASLRFVDLEGCLTTGSSNSTNLHSCFTTVQDYIQSNGIIVLGVLGGLVGVEIVVIVMAFCMVAGKPKRPKSIKVTPA